MKNTILVEIEVTDVVMDKKIEKVVEVLKKRHLELKDIFVSSGKLTSVGKVLVYAEFSRIADHNHCIDLQQGGLGTVW